MCFVYSLNFVFNYIKNKKFMNYKYFLSLFFLLLICTLFSQNTSTNPSLDHNKFIEELSNSQKTIFDNVIKEYDDYLLKHSDDVLIQIEKCLAIKNDIAEFHKVKGEVLLKMNKKDDAMISLKKAKSMGDKEASRIIKENK